MNRYVVRAAALSLGILSIGPLGRAQVSAQNPASAVQELPRYSAEQLDNLISPVALYPDALLAQVLVASTFPDQIEVAADWVRANGTSGIDDMSWDVSVKAVAHYPSVINMMADKADWTATLGRAYAYQSSDVMLATQRMRALADQHGNLISNDQQQVVRESNNYVIVPAQPQVIYVPVYDPFVVYSRPIFHTVFSSRFWSFGVGFPIGGWLNYDLDWGRHAVYYNGWDRRYFTYGGGWRARSFPFVRITNVYVNPRYRDVYVNRYVDQRVINYRNVDRYPRVHGDVYFADVRNGNRGGDRTNDWTRNQNDSRAREAAAREAAAREAAAREAWSRDERARDVGRAVEDARARVERGAVARGAVLNARAEADRTPQVIRSDPSRVMRSEPTRRIGEMPSAASVARSERARTVIGSQREVLSRAEPQRSSPPSVQRSSPPAVQRSAPPAVQRSSPPSVQRSAPPAVQRSSPPSVQRSSPPAVQRQSPPQVQQSAPPSVQRSVPAASSGSSTQGSGRISRRPPEPG